MDTRYSAIVVVCGGPGSAALYWLFKALGLPMPRGGSTFPIEPFRITRPAVADRARVREDLPHVTGRG